MKRVLFFTALLGMGFIQAQGGEQKKNKLAIEKGTWNLAGNFSFGFSDQNLNYADSSTDQNSSFASFAPALGYFIATDIQLGLGGGYGFRNDNTQFVGGVQTTDMDYRRNTFTLYPFVRKYFGLSKNFALYLQAEGRYDRSKIEQKTTNGDILNADSSSDSLFMGIRPGLTFFVSNNFAFETGLGSVGYETASYNTNSNTTSESDGNSFNLNLSSSDLIFGLSYYF
ncbi:MAG: hypothetical protein ABJN84_09535 [Flavobacteriaceae bacterium]